MSSNDYLIRRNRFKGKKITYASTDQIESFGRLTNEFMERIFDLDPNDFLISDESDLLDFAHMGSSDTSEIWLRITEHFGVDFADVGSERLVRIFSEIGRRRNLQ